MLTQQDLKRFLHYDQTTGLFTRLARLTRRLRPNKKFKAGTLAGFTMNTGYLSTHVLGKSYLCHRLAWLYVHGQWPKHYIDHINGNRTDNRIENLRSATQTENMCNRRETKANKYGLKGVCWDKERKKYFAQIKVEGKQVNLGRFDTADLAHAAYCKAAIELHGPFARLS